MGGEIKVAESCQIVQRRQKKNDDGSCDLYFGPRPPAGKQSNWVPTDASGKFEVVFRLYGPEMAFFEKKWTLPDIERVPHI